jgi:hypothetical protein
MVEAIRKFKTMDAQAANAIIRAFRMYSKERTWSRREVVTDLVGDMISLPVTAVDMLDVISLGVGKFKNYHASELEATLDERYKLHISTKSGMGPKETIEWGQSGPALEDVLAGIEETWINKGFWGVNG